MTTPQQSTDTTAAPGYNALGPTQATTSGQAGADTTESAGNAIKSCVCLPFYEGFASAMRDPYTDATSPQGIQHGPWRSGQAERVCGIIFSSLYILMLITTSGKHSRLQTVRAMRSPTAKRARSISAASSAVSVLMSGIHRRSVG